jgi:hypothetical protein
LILFHSLFDDVISTADVMESQMAYENECEWRNKKCEKGSNCDLFHGIVLMFSLRKAMKI